MVNGSKQKKAASVHDINRLYRDIVEATNTLIWRTDSEGRFTFLNPAWEKNYGYSVKEMLDKPFSEFQVPEAAEHYNSAFRNCRIGATIIGHETIFYTKNGDEAYLNINMIPLIDKDGTVAGTQGTAFDITERKQSEELLQYISAKDELTDLYNLHTFLSMAEQQVKSAQREQKQMLIIYAGIDGMQSINEHHSRQEGDQLLCEVAAILRKTFREADVLARSGGDEFVVSTLISAEDHEDLIMSRLNENIEAYNDSRGDLPALSISMGTSICNHDDQASIEEVLSRADENMHEEKLKRG